MPTISASRRRAILAMVRRAKKLYAVRMREGLLVPRNAHGDFPIYLLAAHYSGLRRNMMRVMGVRMPSRMRQIHAGRDGADEGFDIV
jgi:hypothetical protein